MRTRIRLKLYSKYLLGVLLSILFVILIPYFNATAQAATKTYTVKSSSAPYKNQYKTKEPYNDKTKQYYMLRSYLELIKKEGGGTLVLTKGTYVVTNTLYLPSNVTILLKDGVKLIKGYDTGTRALSPTKTLFQLIEPSKAGKTSEMGKYDGETGVKLKGEGTARIDLNYVKDATGILLGHNTDITIEGISFQKMKGGRFIKIVASKKVIIKDNVFRFHIDLESNSKEAIAIEIPDKTDLTISQDITMENNQFLPLDPAVKAFYVTPSSDTFQKEFLNYSTYNSKTKQYYMVRSYLEQLENVGGGTLTLAAGTYEICNSLYIPSHVTIYLEDGAVIKKTEQTGTEAMVSAKSLFQLVAPSKAKIAGVYGGYGGETDIKLIGKGKAIIDLNFVNGAIGIIFGHNTDVSISGITFQNMFSGHFIELDSSRNITIENNFFLHHKPSRSGMKEAINIDTPDKNTGGINVGWTNYDCTPNKDILIRNNSFKDLERAIGTHKYSEGKYHENVQIINNKIENTSSDAIRIMNWIKPIITGNEIKDVNAGASTDRAILASGVIHPVIKDNTISDAARAIQIMPWKNNGAGKDSAYAITYNEINSDDIALMLKNNLTRVGERFIRINNTYNVFTRDTMKYYFTGEYLH